MGNAQQHRSQQKRSNRSGRHEQNKEGTKETHSNFSSQKKSNNLLESLKETPVKYSKPPFEFLIQSHQHPDNKLCAYFAYYHYMNGGVRKEDFKAKAIGPYLAIMSEEDALAMFSDGNDPGVYTQFGLSEVTNEAALKGDKLIIADIKRGHFYALRKHNDTWWNYDSYHQTAPTLIGDRTAAMAYLENKGVEVWA